MTSILQDAHAKASLAATAAANAFLSQHFGGRDGGMCGFAWVTYYPKAKGNTSDGRAERRLMETIGFSKDYTGKAWQLWNPSKVSAQSVDAKYAGAVAYAKTLEAEAGIKVYAGERLD
jgi:hypothetical protein